MVTQHFEILLCILVSFLTCTAASASKKNSSCPSQYGRHAPKNNLPRFTEREACEVVNASIQAAGKAGLSKKLPAPAKTLTRGQLRSLYTKMCVASVPAMGLNNLIYVKIEDSSEPGKHYSNYIGGLNLMMAFHACMNMTSPAEARETLRMVLSANMAGNAFFELGGTHDLDFFNLKSRSQTERQNTDWGDFNAGGAATATYYLLIRAIESAYRIQLQKNCSNPHH